MRLCLCCPAGDTVRVVFQTDPGSYKQFILRLEGLDAPEISSHEPAEHAAALASRDRLLNLAAPGVFLQGKIPQAQKAVEQVLHDNVVLVQVHTGAQDKYGRTLARVLTADGIDINSVLLAEGLACAYDGGHKQAWHPKM